MAFGPIMQSVVSWAVTVEHGDFRSYSHKIHFTMSQIDQ